MEYEDLLNYSDGQGVTVKEKDLLGSSGRIKGNKIALKKGMLTVKKMCVLGEEMGHYLTTVGNILDQSKTNNVKQERRARVWSYNKLVGLTGIIDAFDNHCLDIYEMADFLNVEIEFLNNAIDYYHKKYGLLTTLDNYIIYFEPSLMVMKMI